MTDIQELRRRYEERRVQLLVPANPESLKALPIFSGIPEKARDKVLAADGKVTKYCAFVEYQPGEVVINQGAYNDAAYFIVTGAVELLVPRPGESAVLPRVRGGAHLPPAAPRGGGPQAAGMLGRGTSETVRLETLPAEGGKRTVLEAGQIFGEISSLSRHAVSLTVQAVTRVRLLRIQVRGLKNLMQVSKQFKAHLESLHRERAVTYLKRVELLAGLDEALLEELKQRVQLASFEPGQVIVAEGAAAEALLIVRAGYVKVAVRAGTSDLAITYLRAGDHTGEAALLLDETWPFSLQALESVELFKIARADFRELMQRQPKLEDELWRRALQRLKARGAVKQDPTSAEYLQMAMETGLIHGDSVLLIDLTTCVQCDECVRGCADTHGGVPRFVREGERYRNWLVPTACYQCTDPVCMTDCPTGAITRESDSLIVTINPHDHPTRPCIGCGNCAERCPWGNIVMLPYGQRSDGKPLEDATKCDLCHTRPQGPACVQMCPHGCAVRISFRELDRVVAALRR